jgi:hypothetical protein
MLPVVSNEITISLSVSTAVISPTTSKVDVGSAEARQRGQFLWPYSFHLIMQDEWNELRQVEHFAVSSADSVSASKHIEQSPSGRGAVESAKCANRLAHDLLHALKADTDHSGGNSPFIADFGGNSPFIADFGGKISYWRAIL